MARNDLLWVRDAMVSTGDIGDTDTYGTAYWNLLWKAQAGDSIQTAGAQATPPFSEEPELRALAGALPTQDLTGAVVKRIIMEIGVNYAPVVQLPTERTDAMRTGHYEGIAVAPYVSRSGVLGPTQVGTHPGDDAGSVATDWLWWSRRYGLNHGANSRNFGTLPAYEITSFYTIDTRCSRALTEFGSSLYWCVSSSPNGTINGLVAAWSVLLQIPV